MNLTILCRILHIAATCTSLGGLFYARAVLWPTLPTLDERTRKAFLDRMIKRFSYIKWSGVTIIAVTGVWQWSYTYPHILDQKTYILYFALKMLGAVGLFSITFLLALPLERAKGLQKYRGLLSAVNLFCGLIILTGAALMHSIARN